MMRKVRVKKEYLDLINFEIKSKYRTGARKNNPGGTNPEGRRT